MTTEQVFDELEQAANKVQKRINELDETFVKIESALREKLPEQRYFEVRKRHMKYITAVSSNVDNIKLVGPVLWAVASSMSKREEIEEVKQLIIAINVLLTGIIDNINCHLDMVRDQYQLMSELC